MAVHPDHDGGPISTTQGVVADRRGAPGGSPLEDTLPGNWLYLPVLLEWKGLECGLEQGLERGRAEGRRALVGRLATRKFGARTVEQLSPALEDIAVPERLAEVFDAVIDCDSDAELFARVGI